MPTPPDNGDAMSRDIESMHRLVADTEQEKAHRRPKSDIPRDLFGFVSLLPRRLMGGALMVALMAATALGTWIYKDRQSREYQDSETLKAVVTVVIPRINERLNSVEIMVGSLRGDGEKRDRQAEVVTARLNEIASRQARIEGKLDKALR